MGEWESPARVRSFALVGLVLVAASIAGVSVSPAGMSIDDEPGATDHPVPRALDSAGNMTVTGIVSGLGLLEPEFREFAADLLDRNESSLPPHAFGIVVNQKKVIVLANDRGRPGRVTVRGEGFLSLSDNSSADNASVASDTPVPDVIIADSVRFVEDGLGVRLSDLPENRSASQGALFELAGQFRQAGIIHYTHFGPIYYTSFGYLGGEQIDNELLRHPGLVARQVIYGGPYEAARRQVGTDLIGGIRTRAQRPQFWIDTEVTLDGVMYGPEFPHFGPDFPLVPAESGLYVTQLQVLSERTVNVTTLQRTPGEFEGEVISVTGAIAGSRLSASRTILNRSDCRAPPQFPNATDSCEVLPADVTIHAGVLYDGDPEARSDVVPYAALSNDMQQVLRTSENGTFRLVGRVVPIADLDPRLRGRYGLLVYDMRRLDSGMNRTEPPESAVAWGAAVTEAVAWQVNASFEQRQAFLELADLVQPPSTPQTLGLVEASFSRTTVAPGAPLTLQATLRNNGTESERVSLEVRSGDRLLDTAEARVGAGSTERVTFQFAMFEPGEHEILINNWTAGTVTVRDGGNDSAATEQPSTGLLERLEQSTLGLLILGLFLAATVVFVRRRGG